jgi:hypothetical protein
LADALCAPAGPRLKRAAATGAFRAGVRGGALRGALLYYYDDIKKTA